MVFHRYGRERPTARRATAGDVFVAVSRDPWARAKLEEIYRRLFEGEGIRQGSSPDHFIYVTPSSARAEINELVAWVGDRFGPPGSSVPARTPFGYISGPWDGWLTFFAALSFGTDRGLAVDFAESVSGLSWAGTSSMRARAVASTEAPSPAVSRVLPPAGSSWGEAGGSSPAAGSPPVPPSPPAPAPAEKPGFIDRFLGVYPARQPAPPPPATIPVAREEEEEVSPEEEARMERAYRERLERLARESVVRQMIAEREAGRGVSSEGLAIRQRTEAERAADPKVGRWNKPPSKPPAKRTVREEVSASDIQAATEAVRAADEEAPVSTVEQLRRPPGTSPQW